MSKLPMSVTAHSGMLSQNPQALMISTSSCGSVVLPIPLAPAVPMTCEIMPCTMSNTASIRSMPKSTAAFASTKRMNSLRACSGFLTSTKLPQVLTTPAAKNSTSSPYPMACNAPWMPVMTPHTAPPL